MGLYPLVQVNYPSGLPEHSHGNIFYVNYYTGTDTTSWKQGTKASRPFKTITFALTQCDDDDNDIIYVTTHVQVEAQPIVVNKRAVQIIGLPRNTPHAQQARCWIFPDAHVTGGVFTIGAGDVVIKNFMFWSTAGQPCIDFTSEATAVRITIDQCSFHVGSWGIQTGVLGVAVINAPSHYLTITNCLFDPNLSVGGIDLSSDGSWNLIADNFFELVPGPVIHMQMASSGGRILRNHFVLDSDTAGEAITLSTGTRWLIADNIANDAAPDSITANPYTDTPNTHVWARNVKGGAGFTEVAPR